MGFNLPEFVQNHKMIIIGIAAALVVIAIAILITVLVVKKGKSPPPTTETFIEGYVGTDAYTDQFKYAESYINSVLGV